MKEWGVCKAIFFVMLFNTLIPNVGHFSLFIFSLFFGRFRTSTLCLPLLSILAPA
jgi:hypothetical protein